MKVLIIRSLVSSVEGEVDEKKNWKKIKNKNKK